MKKSIIIAKGSDYDRPEQFLIQICVYAVQKLPMIKWVPIVFKGPDPEVFYDATSFPFCELQSLGISDPLKRDRITRDFLTRARFGHKQKPNTKEIRKAEILIKDIDLSMILH